MTSEAGRCGSELPATDEAEDGTNPTLYVPNPTAGWGVPSRSGMVVGPNDEAREEEEEEEEEEEDAIIVRIIDEDLEELLAKAMMADLARGAAVDDDAVTALAKRSCSVFKAIFMVDTTIKLFLCVLDRVGGC
jgi:hypothetical protein